MNERSLPYTYQKDNTIYKLEIGEYNSRKNFQPSEKINQCLHIVIKLSYL